jgi:uncharacterized protein
MDTEFGLTDNHLKIIRSIFSRFSSIQRVILYGSRAKGNYRPGSDIDMTIISDGPFDFSDLTSVMNEFEESDLPYLTDLSLFSTLTNEHLIDHIKRMGKIIYERTGKE